MHTTCGLTVPMSTTERANGVHCAGQLAEDARGAGSAALFPRPAHLSALCRYPHRPYFPRRPCAGKQRPNASPHQSA
eukprot:8636374-Pyramimonas_sp.AAC.1